jgi:Holliday junction resolvasome RuvABC DNA-binding subunit
LIGLFQQSLSEVDRINADMKIESAIRLYEWEQQVLEAREQLESGEQFETSVECSETMDRLGAGLRGLGFAKHDVQKFVESVKDRTDSMQVLLTEGIKQLNGKL